MEKLEVYINELRQEADYILNGSDQTMAEWLSSSAISRKILQIADRLEKINETK
jgi:hypothetical protein